MNCLQLHWSSGRPSPITPFNVYTIICRSECVCVDVLMEAHFHLLIALNEGLVRLIIRDGNTTSGCVILSFTLY